MPPTSTTEDWITEHLEVGSWSGYEAISKCLYHSDTDPSMWVNVDKGVFLCFACRESGTIEKLASTLGVAPPGMPSRPKGPETTQELVRRVRTKVQALRVDGERPDLRGLLRAPERELLTFVDDPDRWQRRGVWPHVQERFELGYDPVNDALAIPLRTLGGHYVGACRRYLAPDAELRYKYPAGFKSDKLLYGAHEARQYRAVGITEGSIDALRLWSLGLPAVAVLGSDLSYDQLQLLLQLDCVRYYAIGDGDEAGRRLNEQMVNLIGPRCRVIELPDGADPGNASSATLMTGCDPRDVMD